MTSTCLFIGFSPTASKKRTLFCGLFELASKHQNFFLYVTRSLLGSYPSVVDWYDSYCSRGSLHLYHKYALLQSLFRLLQADVTIWIVT